MSDLDFSYNRIKSLGYALQIYPRLRHLNLAYNEIRSISGELASHEQLEVTLKHFLIGAKLSIFFFTSHTLTLTYNTECEKK